MKKAIVLLANGFEEIEALSPVDYLRRAGVEVVVLGIGNSKIITGAHDIKVECDELFSEYRLNHKDELCDAIVIPGGMPGALNISKEKDVVEYIKFVNQNQKLVCAICAAPIVVLAQTKILCGKNFTCYPGMEENINDFLFYVDDKNDNAKSLLLNSTLHKESHCVVDNNLITSCGPGAAQEFAMQIVNKLCGTDVMNKIKIASCQR